jgi:hypothetical protein
MTKQQVLPFIKKRVNYVVTFWHSPTIECETISEVSKALGKGKFGEGFSVSSPTGKDVSEFIPF